jgi:hypothetical protein
MGAERVSVRKFLSGPLLFPKGWGLFYVGEEDFEVGLRRVPFGTGSMLVCQ